MIMSGDIILFDYESRMFKHPVKNGRMTLAWILANGQKKKKRHIGLLILLSVSSHLMRFFNPTHHSKPQ